VRGYAYLQIQRADDAKREFDRSLEVGRDVGALYEVALSLRARALVHRSEADAVEARALLETLHVHRLPDVPLL
jgi:hypothetical protein